MPPHDFGRVVMIPFVRRTGVVRRIAAELAADVAASLAARMAAEARILRAYGVDQTIADGEVEAFRTAVMAAVLKRIIAAGAARTKGA